MCTKHVAVPQDIVYCLFSIISRAGLFKFLVNVTILAPGFISEAFLDKNSIKLSSKHVEFAKIISDVK